MYQKEKPNTRKRSGIFLIVLGLFGLAFAMVMGAATSASAEAPTARVMHSNSSSDDSECDEHDNQDSHDNSDDKSSSYSSGSKSHESDSDDNESDYDCTPPAPSTTAAPATTAAPTTTVKSGGVPVPTTDASSTGGSLPATGNNPATLAVFALALLLAGLFIVRLTRRPATH